MALMITATIIIALTNTAPPMSKADPFGDAVNVASWWAKAGAETAKAARTPTIVLEIVIIKSSLVMGRNLAKG